MIHTKDIPGHIIETIDIITEVLHDVLIPVIIISAMTPHITDCLHTGALPHTLGIRADHISIQHTNQVRTLCINLQHIPTDLKTSQMIEEIQES